MQVAYLMHADRDTIFPSKMGEEGISPLYSESLCLKAWTKGSYITIISHSAYTCGSIYYGYEDLTGQLEQR